jgi:6-methylsalicylate decarboxylase
MSEMDVSQRREMAGIIDVHHHIVPDEYVRALADKGITKAVGAPLPKWSLGATLDVMDENGIAAAIVSISAPGVYFAHISEPLKFAKELSRRTNEICAEFIHRQPGRFGAFATLPLPDIDAALAELEHALDRLALDGVILLSNYGGYYLGDPKFEALFAELNRRKSVAFIHPASPPGCEKSYLGLPEAMLDVCFDTTRTAFSLIVNGVTKRYPDVRFILAHAGGAVPYMAARVGMTSTLLANARGVGPAIADGAAFVSRLFPGLKEAMPELLTYYINVKENVLPEGPDFYLKTFYYDMALSASPHALSSLLTLDDSSRILFGSDYIFVTRAAVPLTIEGVKAFTGFTRDDLGAVANGTAANLFSRFKNRST